jgi:hypothetical protein
MKAQASWDANGAPLDIEIRDSQLIERAESLPQLSMRDQVTVIGHVLSQFPQTEMPLKHHFAPGVYLREISMPADTVVIGRIHKTEHFNILVKGACLIVHDDGRREELRAPQVFVSKAGVQKVLYIIEDMIWMTAHVTSETDVEKLEEMLTEPIPPNPLEKQP